MPISDYTPTVADVGALLRSRTRDAQGAEIGTFNATTRPTDTEVNSLIQDAVNEAYPVFGAEIPAAPGTDPLQLKKAALRIVALRAAALVELSYFPEQVAQNRSAYAPLQDNFEKGLARVGKAIAEAGAGDEPGTSDDYLSPISSFPEDGGGMVGWGTRF